MVAAGTAAAQDDPITLTATPALRNLVGEAPDQNLSVQAAHAAVEAAGARRQCADQPLYNPELERGAEQAETRTATLGLSPALDGSDKRGARTDRLTPLVVAVNVSLTSILHSLHAAIAKLDIKMYHKDGNMHNVPYATEYSTAHPALPRILKYLPVILIGLLAAYENSPGLLVIAAMLAALSLAFKDRIDKVDNPHKATRLRIAHVAGDGGSFPGDAPMPQGPTKHNNLVIDGGCLEHHRRA